MMSRTDKLFVVPDNPTDALVEDIIPTSAKFFNPEGWIILLTGGENLSQVIGLLIE